MRSPQLAMSCALAVKCCANAKHSCGRRCDKRETEMHSVAQLALLLQANRSSICVQRIDGVDDIAEGYNPATWMLEVTGASYKSKSHKNSKPETRPDFPQTYRDSQLGRENSETAAQIVKSAAADTEPLKLSSRYAATEWQQIVQVTKKLFLVYWCARCRVALQPIASATSMACSATCSATLVPRLSSVP